MSYYLLRLYPATPELREWYVAAANKHNAQCQGLAAGASSVSVTGEGAGAGGGAQVPALSAGGFDLYQPSEVVVGPGLAHVLDQQVQCHMLWRPAGAGDVEHLVSYYLYPRSSTGLNTPLRLSNSVGIIDAGYRGSIKALFDNFSADFTVQKQQRLVQVCPPNLTYPLLVEVVLDVLVLGTTARGMGGLGSTGR